MRERSAVKEAYGKTEMFVMFVVHIYDHCFAHYCLYWVRTY